MRKIFKKEIDGVIIEIKKIKNRKNNIYKCKQKHDKLYGWIQNNRKRRNLSIYVLFTPNARI